MSKLMQEAYAKKVIPFHVGILVADLQGAIEKFSRVLGISFGPIQEMTVNGHGIVEGKIKMKVAYSTEGPIYIELIQGTEQDCLFSLKNGEGFHHLGVWSEDYAAYEEREPNSKLATTVKMNIMPGDPTFWFSDPDDMHGTRLEFLNSKMRRGMESWIKGEDQSI